ncbi:hypothetical protein GCM10009557_14050 [Virgisporangium ochraceum]|uniref:XRE family transcriptional regulator n=1 Tax=Virgisporangium ochraceum TaxID=65505 RepID=A0A8J4A649_9ACTN|nr:hypothetical protein Voc01_094820 [Virgisporangium ochraceum]
MDNRAEVHEFPTSRRAKITPELAGLPSVGVRRVPGLRRAEVATLAGMSVEYHSTLERFAGAARRARPPPDHLRGRARLADRARARPARLVGRHPGAAPIM